MAKKDFSYNEALAEIETIMQNIESEAPDVDMLTEKVKRVSLLIKMCKEKLRKTEDEIQKILDDMEAENE